MCSAEAEKRFEAAVENCSKRRWQEPVRRDLMLSHAAREFGNRSISDFPPAMRIRPEIFHARATFLRLFFP